jgi:hypothetical protein
LSTPTYSTVFALIAAWYAGLAGCKHAPLPLDPLTPAEETQAEQIARADLGVSQALGRGRNTLVYAAFVNLKPTAGRAARVVFYSFEGNFGVRAIVNLESKRVISVERLKGTEVPLTGEEWGEALRLALKTPDILGFLGPDIKKFQELDQKTSDGTGFNGNAVRVLMVVSKDPKDACFQDRCAELFFRRGPVLLTQSALVNLSRRTVLVEKGGLRP